MSSNIQTRREDAVPVITGRLPETRKTKEIRPDVARIPRCVLIVEDCQDLRSLLAYYMETKGYKVLQAEDGKEAIDIAEANPLDFMLVDFELPVLNGLEIVEHLRKQMKFEALPIVMMTSHQGDEVRASAANAGCDELLRKPIDFDRLDGMLDYFAPSTAQPQNEPSDLRDLTFQPET